MGQSVSVIVEGGKATAAPPLGPALGPLGVPIGKVVEEINRKTAELKGMQVPVKVIVGSDKSFTIEDMDFANLIKHKREQILEVARRHGAKNLRFFGSFARGEAGPDSDVDILVDMEPDRSLFDLGELKTDLEALLDKKVDVVTYNSLHPLLRERILKYFPEALLAEKVTEANNKKLHSEIIKAFHDSGSKNTFHEFYVVEVAEQILNWKI